MVLVSCHSVLLSVEEVKGIENAWGARVEFPQPVPVCLVQGGEVQAAARWGFTVEQSEHPCAPPTTGPWHLPLLCPEFPALGFLWLAPLHPADLSPAVPSPETL